MADNGSSYCTSLLFPYFFRYIGILLIFIGIGSVYLYFWGGRPDFFEVPVLALVTSYIDTRWFVVAQTNLLDELAFVFGITGLIFTSFSKEKKENWLTGQLRSYAFILSVYITTGIWIFLYLVVFGWPIILLSATAFILFLVIYFTTFQILLKRVKSTITINIDAG
jgi:hypothetical protein